jgi:ribosomal protein L40E
MIALVLIGASIARGRGISLAADAVIPAQRLSEESESTHFREKEVVTERFLVICPFCGAKNQQGLAKCQNCHASL